MMNKSKACYILMGFFWLVSNPMIGQNQKVADSLYIIYSEDKLEGIEKLELLKDLSFNELNDLRLALRFSEELIELSELKENKLYLHSGYIQKGNKKRLSGDLEEALEAYFNAAKIAKEADYLIGEGTADICIADSYSVMGNSSNAINYYNKAIGLFRNIEDSVSLASVLLNAGDEYFNIKKYDSALVYFEEAGVIFEKVNYLTGIGYTLGNIGMIYAEEGKDYPAESNINKAIKILEKTEDYYPISVYLTYMADIYLRKMSFNQAFIYANRSLELAQKYGLKKQISEANLKLAELYDQTGNAEESYRYYKNHIIYRDSVQNIELVQKMADQRTNFEIAKKQLEVDLLNQQKKNQKTITIASVSALFLIGLLALGLYRRSIYIQKTKRIIELEKDRSESLLLNILPEETATELKTMGSVKAKKFESVTVLFTDFKEFTKLSEAADPELLVQSIDFYFKAFDEITTRYKLEKIKTIGDSYMCAGGLPKANETHAKKVILAAKDIIDFVDQTWKSQTDLLKFEVRIGVHTGSLVAGIVGFRKWQYDIWGDTVNIASRMENGSVPGKINISETTYNEIKDEFECFYRGEIEIKNHGKAKMYFLN